MKGLADLALRAAPAMAQIRYPMRKSIGLTFAMRGPAVSTRMALRTKPYKRHVPMMKLYLAALIVFPSKQQSRASFLSLLLNIGLSPLGWAVLTDGSPGRYLRGTMVSSALKMLMAGTKPRTRESG